MLEIIRLTPDDWQAFRALRLESLLDAPQAYTSSYAGTLERPESSWRQRLQEAADGRRSWMLFAREGQTLVGMMGAFTEGEPPGDPTIVQVYVRPAYRGRGIAGQLMRALLAELRAAGFHRVNLAVTLGQEAALALYRRFGFSITREQTARLGDGQDHIEYIMEKAL